MRRIAVWKTIYYAIAVLVTTVTACIPATTGTKHVLDEKRVNVDLPPAQLIEIVSALSDDTGLPVSLEQRFGPGKAQETRYKVSLVNLSLREALDKVVEKTGRYTWNYSEDPISVNLTPKQVLRDSGWTLNRKCPAFTLRDASIQDAVKAVSDRVFPAGKRRITTYIAYSIVITPGTNREDHPLVKFYNKRLTASIREGAVRAVFNQIATAIGDAWWFYGEQEGRADVAVTFYPIHPNTLPVPPVPPPTTE